MNSITKPLTTTIERYLNMCVGAQGQLYYLVRGEVVDSLITRPTIGTAGSRLIFIVLKAQT